MPDDLLTSVEAAEILTKNSNKIIQPQYLNQLVRQRRIKPYKIDARTNMYSRADVEKIVIRERGRPKKVKTEK